jgi:hypothetical protein
MMYLHNGENISISPPIQTVSVNKNTVIFADLVGQQRLQLNDSMETTSFLKWLTSATAIN